MARPPATLVQQFHFCLFIYIFLACIFKFFTFPNLFYVCVFFLACVVNVICVIDVMETLISQLAYKYVTVYLYMTVVTAWYSLLV